MEATPMTASSSMLTKFDDCYERGGWIYHGQEGTLIRDTSARAGRRTGSIRAASIRPVERPTFRAENITFEVTRRLLEQPWFDDVLATVRELLALGKNWDGSDELAIHPKAIMRAMQILRAVGEGGPRPDLVPMPNGSVQLEWFYRGQEIKIESPPSGLASIRIWDPSSRMTEVQADSQSNIWYEVKTRLTIDTTSIRRWASAAVSCAVVKSPDDERPYYFATVEDCSGAWAHGDSRDAALAELESVMYGWAHLKLRDGDNNIPPMGGIDLVSYL